MALKFATKTATGTKHRDNEDSALCCPEIGLFAIADGMSGSNGALASSLALEALREYFSMASEEGSESPSQDFLLEAVHAANYATWRTSLKRPECIGMGTTLTSTWLLEKTLQVAHVGDSKCFCWDGKRLEQITVDHAVVLETKQQNRQLTESLGLFEEVRVASYERRLKEGETVLLCTDGITDFVSATELERILLTPSFELNRVAEEIVGVAKRNGSDDDATIVLVQLD